LLKWQKIHRLVGSAEPRWIVENLFLDSLLFLRVLPGDVSTVADLGSGAGLPGVPISIVRPNLSMALIESRERRASFLSTVARELGLDGLRVVNARGETVGNDLAGRFDAVVVRCAGKLAGVLAAAQPLVRPGGGVVVASGPPERRPLPEGGQWVEVDGLRPGAPRRFAIFRL
jgi:16S rRNA (guanine527-N7)-methyltransferase